MLQYLFSLPGIVRGQVAVVKLLCESKANPNKADHYGASPLHYAAEKNFADCAHVLIKKGAIVDIKDQHGRSPLLWAAAGGNIDSLKILLDTKSDINQRDDLGMTGESFLYLLNFFYLNPP